MFDLHYWPTPNGWKISIMLEECRLPYRLVTVNIGKGEQFTPEFLAISPNNRMPAIVDDDPTDGGEPLAVFESGAILIYLAEKTGLFMPSDMRGRSQVLQWLMWQMGGLGPMAGQNGHFLLYAPEKIPYAIDRYSKEVNRLYGAQRPTGANGCLRGRVPILHSRHGHLSMDTNPQSTKRVARGLSPYRTLVRRVVPAPRRQAWA